MNERTYAFDEGKEGWGPGPWQDEPDKVVWVDDATGLDCMVQRGPLGSWCGYVGVPPGHPWFGNGGSCLLGHEDCYEHEPDVHGGVTFAALCKPGALECQHEVCHDPDLGAEREPWWVGFDCAHSGDLSPAVVARRSWSALGDEVYRDLAYARAEVASLAGQAAKAA